MIITHRSSGSVRKLLEPIKIGGITLRNRMFMSAMNDNMCSPDGTPTDQQIAYYEARAKGGVGLVITGNAYVDDHNSQIASGQLGVYSDRLVPHLNRLAEAVKKAGARIVMQLVHGGRQASHAWHKPLWAPSAIPCAVVGLETKAMSIGEIHLTIHNFIEGARRAYEAGFDGVELHFGHGYLLSQFLSCRTNKRTDEYGGSLANNARICLEILRGIRSQLGLQFVIGVKLNVHEAVKEGITIDQAQVYARWFEEAGCDYITATAGIYESGDEQCQSIYIGRGYNVHLAAELKKVLHVPVAAVGSINDPSLAEEILARGDADVICVGRPLIADPELINKLAEGREDDIRKCIRCNDCQGRLVENRVITCAINAEVGREREYKLVPAAVPKKVVVIGGGPGGLETAYISALRGHQVVLFEKRDRIGGTCLPLDNPDFKKELENMPQFYMHQFVKLGVELRLNTEATPDIIKEERPDALVIAAGAVPIRHDIPGDGSVPVIQALDAINRRGEAGQRVAVVGAGLVGCETALYLAKQGKNVVLITRRSANQAASGLNALAAYRLQAEMSYWEVDILGNMEVSHVEGGRLYLVCSEGGPPSFLELDTIVPARGFTPNAEWLESMGDLAPHCYAIGDSVRPGTILEAIADGAYIARQI